MGVSIYLVEVAEWKWELIDPRLHLCVLLSPLYSLPFYHKKTPLPFTALLLLSPKQTRNRIRNYSYTRRPPTTSTIWCFVFNTRVLHFTFLWHPLSLPLPAYLWCMYDVYTSYVRNTVFCHSVVFQFSIWFISYKIMWVLTTSEWSCYTYVNKTNFIFNTLNYVSSPPYVIRIIDLFLLHEMRPTQVFIFLIKQRCLMLEINTLWCGPQFHEVKINQYS